MISVLAGGVGAARYLRGLLATVEPADVTAIVNTGDDTVMHGLAISPDLDTVTYTLAGAIDPSRGWGLTDETWQAMTALARYTPQRPPGSRAGDTWFGLGDQDLATHLYRTSRRSEGASLTEITAEIVRAWGLELRILPMTDDAVRTVVTTSLGRLEFQEYFVAHRHGLAVSAVEFVGADQARPGPDVLDVLTRSDAIVIAPSNPLVSIGPIRALAGIDDVLRSRRDRVVAVSPIVAGTALKGPADRMMTELGHEASVVGVARLYAPICSVLVIDEADAALRSAVEDTGMRCVVTPTVMSDIERAAALARTTLEAVR